MHDKTFLSKIEVPPFSMLVFDRAYNYYKQFKKWTDKQIYFVTRQKSNAVYAVLKTISKTTLTKIQAGLLKEEGINMSFKEKKAVVTLLQR